MYDDYEPWDPDVNPVTGKKKLTGDYTRKTSRQSCHSRPRVDHLPESIKEPSLDEGVPFVQKMAKDDCY